MSFTSDFGTTSPYQKKDKKKKVDAPYYFQFRISTKSYKHFLKGRTQQTHSTP